MCSAIGRAQPFPTAFDAGIHTSLNQDVYLSTKTNVVVCHMDGRDMVTSHCNAQKD